MASDKNQLGHRTLKPLEGHINYLYLTQSFRRDLWADRCAKYRHTENNLNIFQCGGKDLNL